MNVTIKQKARIAGGLYLLMGITGAFGLIYVPSKIDVAGDYMATVENLKTSEFQFRMGILSHLACQVIFIFLVLALNRLLRPVNKLHAKLMVSLVMIAVPVAMLIELNKLAALILIGDADFLSAFDPGQINTMIMIFLKLYDYGIYVVELFWGLWLLPFGYLVYKSGFIPKFIGILLMIACTAYMLESITQILVPDATELITKVLPVLTIGEVVVMLWLLIFGVKSTAISGVGDSES